MAEPLPGGGSFSGTAAGSATGNSAHARHDRGSWAVSPRLAPHRSAPAAQVGSHYEPHCGALIVGVLMPAQKGFQLSLDGLSDGSLGMGTDQIGHLVSKSWLQEWNCRIVAHGGILLV